MNAADAITDTSSAPAGASALTAAVAVVPAARPRAPLATT